MNCTNNYTRGHCWRLSMDLQEYLKKALQAYTPLPPDIVSRNKHDITLTWVQPGLQFLEGELLYRVERKEKIPPWMVEYSGSKTTKRINNLMPCYPHMFRLKVIVKASAVPRLAELAIQYYSSEDIAREKLRAVFKDLTKKHHKERDNFSCRNDGGKGDGFEKQVDDEITEIDVDGGGDDISTNKRFYSPWSPMVKKPANPWLESQYSDVMTTNMESVGSSAMCFCVAVRGGHIEHVQMMLKERPDLVNITNNADGFTPLATAVRIGDIVMVQYLLSMGAEVDQRSCTWQTPLHFAVLNANTAIADLLLEKGAEFKIRDRNDLRIEHYAVDSGDLFTLRYVLDRGGNVKVKDTSGCTPLFRAVVHGASTAMIEELLHRGSDIGIVDQAGLSLIEAAKRLTDRHGNPRKSVLRLIDSHDPRDKALATFNSHQEDQHERSALMKH